jgi:proteasome assembly chaperone (PAC2) family protein
MGKNDYMANSGFWRKSPKGFYQRSEFEGSTVSKTPKGRIEGLGSIGAGLGYFQKSRSNERLSSVFDTLNQLKAEIRNMKEEKTGEEYEDLILEMRETRQRNEELYKKIEKMTKKRSKENFENNVNRLFIGNISKNVELFNDVKTEYEKLMEQMNNLEEHCWRVQEENERLKESNLNNPSNFYL